MCDFFLRFEPVRFFCLVFLRIERLRVERLRVERLRVERLRVELLRAPPPSPVLCVRNRASLCSGVIPAALAWRNDTRISFLLRSSLSL